VSRLTDLIVRAKAKDPQPGAGLDQEFKQLSSRLPFGLNFERHRPEAVELPKRPIRKGDKVRVLPPRGSTKKGDPRLQQIHEQPRRHRRASIPAPTAGAGIVCGRGGVRHLPPVQPSTLPGSLS
jgi:adenine-specific DNA-methyltransferase